MSGRASVTVRPLTPSIGAEVTGVDLGDLDDDAFTTVHQAFLDHCVLVFPSQFLQPDAQRRFATRWGQPIVTPSLADFAEPGYPEILHVTNSGKANAVTESWHFDSAFFPRPPAITILAAQRLPPVGGDTMWANQYAAYDALSPALRNIVDDLRAKFCGSQRSLETGEREDVYTFHPVAARHPETGAVALRVGHPGDSVTGFEGMTEDESWPLLEYLYRHASRPDFTYRHQWRRGDVVMWDNRCTIHYAVHDYGDAERVLNRTTVDVDVDVV